MRAGQKDQPCNWRAGALSYLIRAGPPDLLEMISLPSRREGSLDIEFNHVASDSINHAYIMKSPPTLWTMEVGGASRLVNTSMCQGVLCPHSMGRGHGMPSDLTLYMSLFGWS